MGRRPPVGGGPLPREAELPIALIRRVAAGLFLVFAVVAVVGTVRTLT